METINTKTLNKFFEELTNTLDISDTHYEKAKSRYESVGRWLCRDGSKVAEFNPEIYPQGSFRLGTVIKPINDKEEYDIDLVCKIDFSKTDLTQNDLKELTGDEIKSYVMANNMKNPAEEGRRCWKINYADEAQFHLDILPAIPDDDLFITSIQRQGIKKPWAETSIVITDKEHDKYNEKDNEWPRSNPIGYCEWFKSRMEARLRKLEEANIQNVPEYKIKTPLQRSIQLLKRYRDIMFSEDPENQDNKPISIIITTLAALSYNNEDNVFEALQNIINKMESFITNKNGVSWIANPVNPDENFADKWQEFPIREKVFINWLHNVRTNFENALSKSNLQDATEILEHGMGKNIVKRAIDKVQISMPSVIIRNKEKQYGEISEPNKPWFKLFC